MCKSVQWPYQIAYPYTLTEFLVLSSGSMSGVRAMLQLTMQSGEQLLPLTLYVLSVDWLCFLMCKLLTGETKEFLK